MEIGNKTSLSFLNDFSLNMDIPMVDFQENAELITSAKFTDVGIKRPNFPINFATESGVRFIAAIMGDGELNSQLNVRYNNQDESLINIVLNSARDIFGGVDTKLYYRTDKTYQLHFPKIVGILVSLLGIKSGYKSKTNYGIPTFIFNLNKRLRAVFIRQFFNDEGNVRLKDRRLQVKQTCLIKVSKQRARKNPLKYTHRSLVDLQKLLASLGIDSKISLGAHRGDRADWELSIYRIENLKRFRKLIDFDVEHKRELLDLAIKSYKFPSAARNGRLEFALECAKTVQKKHGFITKQLLAKKSKRSLKTAMYYLIDLKKNDHVVCTEKPRRNGKPYSHRYIMK
ncbi:MAG: LAGLIDADG family homing endonuclease [Candidatus Woesearchaeota archaeon]